MHCLPYVRGIAESFCMRVITGNKLKRGLLSHNREQDTHLLYEYIMTLPPLQSP